MAAGASPTGGVGGIFYFLLLVIGVMRHTYNRAKKSIVAEKYVASFVLLFALTSVAVINIVLVYRLVNFQLFSGESGSGLWLIGVQLNWQFQSAVIFALTLLGMFVVGFLLMRESERSLLYRAGCVIMSLIFVILIIWLPIGILQSLNLINMPF
jgi:hypothetical protein